MRGGSRYGKLLPLFPRPRDVRHAEEVRCDSCGCTSSLEPVLATGAAQGSLNSSERIGRKSQTVNLLPSAKIVQTQKRRKSRNSGSKYRQRLGTSISVVDCLGQARTSARASEASTWLLVTKQISLENFRAWTSPPPKPPWSFCEGTLLTLASRETNRPNTNFSLPDWNNRKRTNQKPKNGLPTPTKSRDLGSEFWGSPDFFTDP